MSRHDKNFSSNNFDIAEPFKCVFCTASTNSDSKNAQVIVTRQTQAEARGTTVSKIHTNLSIARINVSKISEIPPQLPIDPFFCSYVRYLKKVQIIQVFLNFKEP